MIAGIGVDIAETSRFSNLYERYGERFARRILTDAELEQFHRRAQSVLFLATRFAVKEAAAKSLGTGFAQGVNYKSIEVSNDAQGKPQLSFYRAALKLTEQLQVANVFVSLSDEKNYVVATVVLESN
ncbi:MAG: holo-ACP synthase [Gammaproteobacteria bacterium]|nr:holo-ACP synthase [Gammaproteobacteria bacterium]